MVAGSMGANYVQEKALDAAGFDDAEQRAANTEAHPAAAFVGGLAPAVATMSPLVAAEKLSAQAIQRGAGAVMMGGFEAGQEYLNEGHVDPAKAAAAAAVGAVFPGVNRVGQKFVGAGERFVPGRPNRTANPAADQAHVDVADANQEVEVGTSSLAQPPHVATGDTTGNPQSAPERSARVYAKDKGPVPPEGDMLTQGHSDPATQAALEASNPAPAAGQAEVPQPPAQPAGEPVVSPNAAKPRLSLKRPPVEEAPQATMPSEPVVEAGFPQAGEPVAVGANEATPVPPGTPERAAKAIARSKGRQKVTADPTELSLNDNAVPPPASKPMPELKGETPLNDSITDAQKAAGNYPKARTHDFGKPVKVETHAGDIRRSPADAPVKWENTSPYDYGYFNKTVGPDKDPIDFARPKAGDAAQGDKHFIIDQRDLATGKYDEPKVFTYYKDADAARAHYEAGFSDGKGAERLGAITEVTRPELVKFLAKHTSKPPKAPYGEMTQPTSAVPGQKKPVKERAVFQDLLAKKPEMAAALQNAPDEAIEAAIAGKRTRKYGVGTGASAGYPVEGVLTSEGKPVTANTKAKAAERGEAHKAVSQWFEKAKAAAKPDESNGDLLDRVRSTHTDVKSTWVPSHKPKEWLWAREAKKLLTKPTPGNIAKFREAERLLHGDEAAVEAYRGGNRVEADIAQSRRSGDEAVTAAENAQHLPGVNAEEDAMIAAIDAKKGGKFDVPHEEAEAMVKPTPVTSRAGLKKLPRKTVDASDSSLAKIDTKAISKEELRKAEAAKLAGQKSAKPAGVESEGGASTVRQIKVTDPAEIARLTEMLNKASSKKAGLDALPAEPEAKAPRGAKDLFDHFMNDERGSADIGKIKQDLDRWMSSAFKRTEPKSYRAKTLKTAHDEYVQSLSDDLHKINQEDRNYFIQNLQKLEAMPGELRAPEAMKKIYEARDKDSANFPLPAGQTGTHVDNLPPRLKALYDEHLKPILDQNDQFVQAIRALDPDRIGPDVMNHISRITKGDTSEYNMLKSTDDPTQPTYNGLSVSANAAKLRKFYALEGADGRRYVVQPTDKGFVKWDKFKRENIKDPTFEFEDGKVYKAGPNDYTMRQATTKEIMDNALGGDGKGKPMRYYTNAGFSAAVSNAQLGSMMRHLTELHRLTETPQFKKLSTRNAAKADERGWEQSTLPNMKGTYLHPELKAVFDDFAGHPQGTYRKLNSAITKMLFWMPTAHINNVAAHWVVGRGWDNFAPMKQYRMVFEDIPKAIKSVVNQDALQMEMRREGAGTIYGSVVTRRLMEQFAKKLQIQMEQEPGRWGPIADKLGVPLKALGRAVYDNSSKVMWAANDVFLTQRVLELQRKGMTMKQAIVEAERDIPNYRIPHVIGGSGEKSRMFAQFMGDPALTAFGRYHYGMYNSYANIIKDAVGKHAMLGDRVDAAGKLLAMGVLAMSIYPLLDKFAQFVTGNEAGKAARRGPVTVPTHLLEAAEGKQDIAAFARGSLTIPPLISALLGAYSNKDFRGKSIVEPGDVRSAFHGSGKAAVRAATQAGEYTARSLVSPFSTFANAAQKAEPGTNPLVSAARAVRDQALDIKDPSKKAVKYEKLIPVKTNRDALSRFRHGGSGPVEGLVNKGTGYR